MRGVPFSKFFNFNFRVITWVDAYFNFNEFIVLLRKREFFSIVQIVFDSFLKTNVLILGMSLKRKEISTHMQINDISSLRNKLRDILEAHTQFPHAISQLIAEYVVSWFLVRYKHEKKRDPNVMATMMATMMPIYRTLIVQNTDLVHTKTRTLWEHNDETWSDYRTINKYLVEERVCISDIFIDRSGKMNSSDSNRCSSVGNGNFEGDEESDINLGDDLTLYVPSDSDEEEGDEAEDVSQ